MRLSLAFVAIAGLGLPAFAQDTNIDCDTVYQKIVADKPIDLASCDVEVAGYTLETCEEPQTDIPVRPKSHVLLAMDASGSMTGHVGGETKMQAAKREAHAFLRDLPREIKVGLVVYGHRGDNTEGGKALSCSASELIHSFDASRQKLEQSIASLSPTGWTPLGGVLEYSREVVAGLALPLEGDLAPVVYLISDGEETCEGDPVAAARALYQDGVQTTVNTIGFDVDAETAAQLEAIAEAAGGIYYPAKDAQALRAQMQAIRDAEGQLARYKLCVDGNAARIAAVYHNARVSLAGCYQRNNPLFRRSAVSLAMQQAKQGNLPEAACADTLLARVKEETAPFNNWLEDRSKPLVSEPLGLIEQYRASESLLEVE